MEKYEDALQIGLVVWRSCIARRDEKESVSSTILRRGKWRRLEKISCNSAVNMEAKCFTW